MTKNNEDSENIEKNDALLKCEEQAQEYLNGWKRTQADFINYKNEESKRIESIAKYGNETTIKDVLSVLDSFDLIMKSIPEVVTLGCVDWLKGLETTVRQFDEFLTKHGVTRIEVKEDSFNPAYHEAVETLDGDQNSIQEVRTGYMMKDRVIRPSRVKIIVKNN